MNTIPYRLKQFIDYKGISILAFEREINAGNNSIGTSIKRNSNLSGDLLSKILYKYSELNPEWLLIGKGKMLKEGEVDKEDNSTVDWRGIAIERLYTINLQREKIQQLEDDILFLKKSIPISKKTTILQRMKGFFEEIEE
jgi:hypothetical protein